jgi:hypothetical protein
MPAEHAVHGAGAPSKRTGRPSVGPELRGVRVDQATFDEIERLAAISGDTRSEVVRILLSNAIAAMRERPRPVGADPLEAQIRAIVRDELRRSKQDPDPLPSPWAGDPDPLPSAWAASDREG